MPDTRPRNAAGEARPRCFLAVLLRTVGLAGGTGRMTEHSGK